MNNNDYVFETIRSRFQNGNRSERIPLQRDGFFLATLVGGGIEVDNLGNQSFLPWEAFEEAISVIIKNGGKAQRGDAMNSKLGEAGLPLDSIEGHVAHVVYGKQIGESVIRRISPIAAILVWAGLCDSAPGELLLH